jgi:hypothetical protein
MASHSPHAVQGPIRRAAAKQARQTAALTQGRPVTSNNRGRKEREGAVAGEGQQASPTKMQLSTGLQGTYMILAT